MIPQIKTNSTFRFQPKHISNSKQKMTVKSTPDHSSQLNAATQLHAVPHALPNLNEKKAEHLLSKLRNKEIRVVEALQELRALGQLEALPKQLYFQILREAQISLQALPDDQQEKVLNNPTVSKSLKNLPSHPIFADNPFYLFNYLPPNFTNKGEV